MRQDSALTLEKLYGASFYREDVQGLRALGALLIMVFHIWFNKVSGGVDVFIVVSGFLMTALLLRGWLASGARYTTTFWSKVIARIAPSAYIVLFVTIVVGYFVLPPSSIPAFVFETIAATFHLENLILINQSIDYLAADTSPSPVQHFWALSVQVQFYAVLPLVLIPMAVVAHAKRSAVPLIVGFAGLLCISFLYATYKVYQDPVSAYFNTFARGWEFLAGGLVFLLSPWVNLKRHTASLLAALGIALVLGSAFLIPRGAAYPGPVALVPVLAAVLILLSGLPRGFQNKLLSSKAMVFIGSMSFTIYLWHWPILIFYRELFNTHEVSVTHGLLIMLLSIALGYVTKHVESAIKKRVGGKTAHGYLVGALCILPVAALAFYLRADTQNVQQQVMEKWASYDFSAGSPLGGIDAESDFYIDRRELLSARQYLPKPYALDCHQNEFDSGVKTCSFGDTEADKQIVLVGGSHATQWLPALADIGARHGFKVTNITKASCPLGAVESSDPSCFTWNDKVIEKIIALDPALVVTNSTRTEPRREYIPHSYVQSWQQVTAHNVPVLGIRDNPWFDFDAPECVHRNSDNHYACAEKRADHLEQLNPALAHADLIYSVDMTDFYCTSDLCPVTYNGYLIYRDHHHLHVPYVKLLTDALEQQMREVYPRLFE